MLKIHGRAEGERGHLINRFLGRGASSTLFNTVVTWVTWATCVRAARCGADFEL